MGYCFLMDKSDQVGECEGGTWGWRVLSVFPPSRAQGPDSQTKRTFPWKQLGEYQNIVNLQLHFITDTKQHHFLSGKIRKQLSGLHIYLVIFKKPLSWASLVAQWLRICLPMQGTRVRALVWEDPTCRGATGPVSHNY